MASSSRLHGFTAWANARLVPEGFVLQNVASDLLKGRHIQVLLETLTGKMSKRIGTLDGLSVTQVQTRMEWMLNDLQAMGLITLKAPIDCRLLALRDSDVMFAFLWLLVSRDIYFVWERSKFLQQDNNQSLISHPFTWKPPPPPERKTLGQGQVSLLAGFASHATDQQLPASNQIQWTSKQALLERDAAIIHRNESAENYPSPVSCIFSLVNAHLKMTSEGRRLSHEIWNASNVGDSRLLCALVNSFIPGCFTSEVLLNDRWTINLILQSVRNMFQCPNPFTAEDFAEEDEWSVAAYFAFFFMYGYKYKQARAVIDRRQCLMKTRASLKEEIDEWTVNEIKQTPKATSRRKELDDWITNIDKELQTIESTYDCADYLAWMENVAVFQEKIRTSVTAKIKEKYEIVVLPWTMTINELVADMMINLSITGGAGFYEAKSKELLTTERKIIARRRESGEIYDDERKRRRSRRSSRAMLGIARSDMVELVPSQYPDYELFLDSGSKNKLLAAGSRFMYRVFPTKNVAYHKMLLKASVAGELDVVEKLINFFGNDKTFINATERASKTTVLHLACRYGHLAIVDFLLRQNADINKETKLGHTPLFLAVEGFNKEIAMLLIEWGAELYHRNRQGRTVLDLTKSTDLQNELTEKFETMKTLCKSVMEADFSLLRQYVQLHVEGKKKFTSLASRCVNGSTLLHTAAYFGEHDTMKILLDNGVDVNLTDYVGATPIHRAKDATAVSILVKAGAAVNAVDQDNNTALHLKCYGEEDGEVDLAVLRKLLENKASSTLRNKRHLMAIHCAAMRGNIHVIEFLLKQSQAGQVKESLLKEELLPPSLPHLALANDHVECAKWLVNHDFHMKTGEANLLLEKVLKEEVTCKDYLAIGSFLIDSGASTQVVYAENNTSLHLAALHPQMTDLIGLLVARGADVNALNSHRCSPLFFATKADNPFGASALIHAGADMKIRNYLGQTPFDLITDIDGWIESGCFSDEAVTRLKAYNLKEARHVIRTITRKVRGLTIVPVANNNRTTPSYPSYGYSKHAFLPPIHD